jgi:ketosteroid isomerase-like protein
MKTTLVLIPLLLVLCAAIAYAQETRSNSPLTSLVNTELAFARTSKEKGMDSAFVAFLADDAVIFRPHPVNGQEWFRSHPAPPIDLAWKPGFADVSVTGDLGYTTGPWTARAKGDTASTPACGEFVTIWKKRGSSWKAVLDLGVSHPATATVMHFTPPARRTSPSVLIRPDSGLHASEWSRLLALEQKAFGDSLHPAPATHLASLMSSDARLFRGGLFPVVGSDSLKEYFVSHRSAFARHVLGGTISRGADLGYTYGSYRTMAREGVDTSEGYYLTVWKKEGRGDWRIVLDLESALPKN